MIVMRIKPQNTYSVIVVKHRLNYEALEVQCVDTEYRPNKKSNLI